MSMPDSAFSIDEVFGWPVSIVIEIPEREVVIEDDWIEDFCVYCCLFYIIANLLKRELRSMSSDDDESLISILRIPRSEIWECTLTVDT